MKEEVVDPVMCFRGSCASDERIFSHVNYIWTEVWSELKVETLRTTVAVQANNWLAM